MMEHVARDVIIMDMALYWLITIILLAFMDFYARRKLGRSSLGFKALRIPKFISLTISSAATILFVVMALLGVDISQKMLTYFGIPYFAIWVFYLCCVFRRVRAERIRRIE
ncbi:MAG: hypothetical protein RR361_00495 [Anaerovorax sp.]